MITFEELNLPKKLQSIRDLADEIWPKTFSAILSPEQISYMMRMMYAPEIMEKELVNGYHFVIVRINGVPAGYFSWSAYTRNNTAKLHKVYLKHEFHGQGIGSLMLKETEKQVKAAGFTRLRLNVNKYNTRARKAYFRNGFADIEAVKIDIGNGFFMDNFVMEKTLITS